MKTNFPARIQAKTVGVSRKGFGTILIHDPESMDDFTLITKQDLKDLGKGSKLYKIAETLFMQDPAPQEVAIAGGDIDELAAEDFYFLVSTSSDEESIEEYSKFAAVNSKMYFGTTHDLEFALEYKDTGHKRGVLMYSHDENEFPAEALAVEMSYKVGGKTANFRRLNGISPLTTSSISRTDLKTLEDNNILTYIKQKGINHVNGSTVLSGERIDVVLGEDWIRARIEENALRLAVNNDKIFYTNQGIGGLVGAVESVLRASVGQGIIMEGQYRVDAIRREDVDPNDVAERYYDGITWEATLSGAIEKGPIDGVITYDMIYNEGAGE